ncbi:hypothetical protein [Acinetobacter thermotolerans]|uniref:hypothetical protein n=1 Tax=Acinetobacter thermotolerans TaxID=3151487 RepID=UPI00325A70C7
MKDINEKALHDAINRILKAGHSPEVQKRQKSQQLADDVDEFLRKGGKITEVPMGQSGITGNEKQVDGYISEGRNRADKKYSTRNSTTTVYRLGSTAAKYDGKPCRTCGGTLRYQSNDRCVACIQKASKEKRNAETESA